MTDAQKPATPLLSVAHLDIEFKGERGKISVLTDVSFNINTSEVVAIVGESGSGKSVTALSIMGLLPDAGTVKNGTIMFEGQDLLSLSENEMRHIRGGKIAMIFQDPMTALNPILTIGYQLTESLIIHKGMTEVQARTRAIELLNMVGIPEAASRLNQYTHQFSGGMRQRVMIAIGLSCGPQLLIADEPTTALDVTIQAQILELMKNLSRQLGISLVIITHNLGVVARYADRVLVMYAGQLVEQGIADAVFYQSRHMYTAGLLSSVPRLDNQSRGRLTSIEGLPPDLSKPVSGCRFAPRCPQRRDVCTAQPVLKRTDAGSFSSCIRASDLADGKIAWQSPALASQTVPNKHTSDNCIIQVDNLTRHYDIRPGLGRKAGTVKAVDGVSFSIGPGETLGLVGESGCGKSTLGRMLLRLEDSTAGRIEFEGRDITHVGHAQLRTLRRRLQVVFQDPYASLNPRKTIGNIISEPLEVHKITANRTATAERVEELLLQVGLRADFRERFPHQISGGQRQRVGIARALALEPSFIVCDEAVSALDVSVQAQIVNLFVDLQQKYGLGYLFIAHDLAVVQHIATRVMVMYLGRVVEIADRDYLYSNPQHPYTRLLLDAAPAPDPIKERARKTILIHGDPPSPFNPPSGCAFRTRCPNVIPDCSNVVPALVEIRPGHQVACIRV